MAVAINVTMTGMGNVRRMFDAVVKETKRPERLLKPWGAILQSETARVFRTQADPATGSPWKRTGGLALGNRPGGGGGGKTLLDTGRLRNALVSRQPRYTKDSVAITTEGISYAAIHQFGGVIKPTVAKFIAVPLTSEARRAGSARRWMNANKAKGPFFFNSSKGKTLIATPKDDPEGGLDFHFLLLPSVTIPARPFLGISDQLVSRVLSTTASVYAKVMAEKARGRGGRS